MIWDPEVPWNLFGQKDLRYFIFLKFVCFENDIRDSWGKLELGYEML